MIAFLHVWLLCGTVGSCLVVLLVWSGAVEAATLTGNPVILDADTVIMSGERIRLKGIDAPETTQRCLDAKQQSYPCGQVATNALIDKIGITPLTCVGDTRDRYTRLMATCYLDDLNLNGWLVQYGHAPADQKCSTRYVSEEEKATAIKRGVWSGSLLPRGSGDGSIKPHPSP
ncbi:MAG: thermonuclease family protein [Nitrospira sp.]|nr:thermonuclease family protein [Nitrospira sp.]